LIEHFELLKKLYNTEDKTMGIVTIILGESGTGKSCSMMNLDPDQTLLIQAIKKPLPFKSNKWKEIKQGEPGSIYVTDNAAHIVAAIQKTKKPIIVIDDFQYIMANEFMRRVLDNETGNSAFQKYNEIARNVWDILNAASAVEGKRVYIMSHVQTDEAGKTKVKTIGKLLDEKIVIEGMVTIVLKTAVINDNYVFRTKNSGNDTVKSPVGLFDDETIPNDLAVVDKLIADYYEA
jgi:hypothetical protein